MKRFRKNKAFLKAMDAYVKAYSNVLPSEDELREIEFSPPFKNKMNRFINRQKKVYYYWTNTTAKKVVCVLTVLLLSALVITFSVGAMRKPLFNFVVKTFREYSEFEFVDYGHTDFSIDICRPGYIPEGYTLESENKATALCMIIYRKDDEHKIVLSTYLNDYSLNIDTEGVKPEKLEVNGHPVFYVEKNGEGRVLVSVDGYQFTVRGPESKEELLKILFSIEYLRTNG